MIEEDPADSPPSTAFELNMMIGAPGGEPEAWQARIVEVDDGGQPGSVLAEATMYRAHLGEDWFAQLDSVDSDLHEVAAAFADEDAAAEICNESAYAPALCVVQSIEVAKHARGRKLSYELVNTLARIFDSDAIALRPAQVSVGEDGELIEDEVKHRALLHHWEAMGFVKISGTEVMLLPMSARA